MHAWHATKHRAPEIYTHSIAGRFGHALLAPHYCRVFDMLGVSAALWEHGAEWFAIHAPKTVLQFELEHGKDVERVRYNGVQLRQVVATRRMARGEHCGCSDIFAPVVLDDRVVAVLVIGPFALTRPSSTEIVERWRWLTGRQAHLSDLEFAAYLAAVLDVPVLAGPLGPTFERFVRCIVRLMGDSERAESIANEAEPLRLELERVRAVERRWEAAEEMIDERSAHRWHSTVYRAELARVGLSRPATGVVVALAVGRSPNADPIDDAVRRDAFARAAVGLAESFGDAIAGRVGDQGVLFLSAAPKSPQRWRRRAQELIDRATRVARSQFGLTLHFGIADASDSTPLNASFEAALAAAESALVRDIDVVAAGGTARRPADLLRQLRGELGDVAAAHPEQLRARFERYLEVVAIQSGHRIEISRAYADVGVDAIIESLVRHGALDERSVGAMREALDRSAGEARTLADLYTAYGSAVSDLCQAATEPVAARHDRGLRRAVEFIHRHYTEGVRMEQVAKLAGITPNYFSRLFHERERMPFERYVLGLRIERAKQLLRASDREVARIAALSGFRSAQYFSRAFRREVGCTPLEFRNDPLVGRPSKVNQKLIKRQSARRSRRVR